MKGDKTARSVSIGDDAWDCSNCSKRISGAIEALDGGDIAPAKALLAELLDAAKSLDAAADGGSSRSKR